MLSSPSLQPKRKLPYFKITEQVRLMAKKFWITRGLFFFGFFQFLLFQFCGISLSDHNFLIAKSSAVSEDLGMLILPSNLDEADQNTPEGLQLFKQQFRGISKCKIFRHFPSSDSLPNLLIF